MASADENYDASQGTIRQHCQSFISEGLAADCNLQIFISVVSSGSPCGMTSTNLDDKYIVCSNLFPVFFPNGWEVGEIPDAKD
jgi:hypothetical protein